MCSEPVISAPRRLAMRLFSLPLFAMLALVLGALGLTACDNGGRATATPGAATVTCKSSFEATIYQGPHTGKAITGELTLNIAATGEVTSDLMQPDGRGFKTVGQVNGHAINLALDLGDNNFIYGVGTSTADIRSCGGYMGGPFTGPSPGDMGEWADPIYIRVISPHFTVNIVAAPDVAWQLRGDSTR